MVRMTITSAVNFRKQASINGNYLFPALYDMHLLTGCYSLGIDSKRLR